MAETRKIAAILAADVVGFSRMTGADEDGTMARLRALRSDLIDPTVASQNVRVFKRTGDGALVEFRSVVEAVRSAIAIQNAMAEGNVGMPPDQRIEFRIGIHLGDVVEESDGDLMGDGVNIAARLEGISQPGAICLSEDAYRQVKAPPLSSLSQTRYGRATPELSRMRRSAAAVWRGMQSHIVCGESTCRWRRTRRPRTAERA
jgi:adenylate cyclase